QAELDHGAVPAVGDAVDAGAEPVHLQEHVGGEEGHVGGPVAVGRPGPGFPARVGERGRLAGGGDPDGSLPPGGGGGPEPGWASTPTAPRPGRRASTSTVPLPKKGSSTPSPGRENDSTSRRTVIGCIRAG